MRQGDICVIPGFPIWDVDRVKRTMDAHDVVESFVMPRHKAFEWDALTGSVAVAVCSHDCDLENPRTRSGVIVAPISRVPARPGDDRYNAIMASSDTETVIDYVHMFPVAYSDAERTVEAVIDFSAMTSMAKAEKVIPYLTKARVLGADDATRASLGRKLALFLGRDYQTKRSD